MTQCPNNFRVTQKTLKSAPHILRACDLSLKSRLISACCPTQAFDQPHRHRPSLAQQFLNSSTANKQRQQADMSMATALTGVPVARAFTATTLRKPRSAQSARRAPLPIRASGDPAAPDKAEVKDEVVDFARTLPGISQPFPNIFDPLNFLGSAGSSNNPIRDVRRWRESEVTHGRVAMLAALGIIVQEQLIDFRGRPFPFVKGPAINHFQQVESKGAIFWVPLVLAIAIAESYRVAVGWNDPTSSQFYSLRDDYEPGNLGFDPLGLLPDGEQEAYDMKTKELNNGRLAMIAVAAFVAQELRSQEPIFAHGGTQLPETTQKVLSGKI